MDRRTFLGTLGGGLLATPVGGAITARAQTNGTQRVGFLNSASATTYSFNAEAFRQGLGQAGYVEGRNVAIEYRWANNDYGALHRLAADLVKGKVAVIARPAISPPRAPRKPRRRRYRSCSRSVRTRFHSASSPA